MLEVIAEGYRLAEDGAESVAVEGEAGWPLSWYFRKTPTSWEAPKPGDRPPLVLCDPEKDAEIRRLLGPGYVSERLPLRAWWVMANHRPKFSEVLRYIFTRRPWGVVGSTDTIVLRYTGEHVEGARDVPVPVVMAETLGVTASKVLGSGWLIEPRGLATSRDGTIAVADVGLGKIVFIGADGRVMEDSMPESLNEPEAAAWTPDGVLVAADTWNHRVLLYNSASGLVRPVPTPEDGWYGPRGVSVAPDGTIAVSDTGHKRIVLIVVEEGEPRIETIGSGGDGPGELNEPVGVVWLDNQRLLVCDTGNRRLQVLDREGLPLEVVPLPDAWTDFYSRPQVVGLSEGRWLLTDPPARSLWLVEDGAAKKIDLGEDGITPTGVARHGNTLYVADIDARVWAFDLPPG
jgi:sugar lactone lactonase YvrE